MNINIEYLNGNKTIGLFFLRSEAVIPDRFKNLILLIDAYRKGSKNILKMLYFYIYIQQQVNKSFYRKKLLYFYI